MNTLKRPTGSSVPCAKPARRPHCPHRWLLGLVLASSLATPALAGNFDVYPVRLELESSQRAGSVDVSSNDAKPLLIRAEVRRWTVENGKDVLTPSASLVATPAVFRLAAGAHQLLRVGHLSKPAPLALEEAYKLVLTEVPEASPNADSNDSPQGVQISLNTTLKLDMPIYVLPKKPRNELSTLLKPAAANPGATPSLQLENRGSVHLKISEISVQGDDGARLSLPQPYVLLMPGAQATLALTSEVAGLKPPLSLHFRQNYAEKQLPLRTE